MDHEPKIEELIKKGLENGPIQYKQDHFISQPDEYLRAIGDLKNGSADSEILNESSTKVEIHDYLANEFEIRKMGDSKR